MTKLSGRWIVNICASYLEYDQCTMFGVKQLIMAFEAIKYIILFCILHVLCRKYLPIFVRVKAYQKITRYIFS